MPICLAGRGGAASGPRVTTRRRAAGKDPARPARLAARCAPVGPTGAQKAEPLRPAGRGAAPLRPSPPAAPIRRLASPRLASDKPGKAWPGLTSPAAAAAPTALASPRNAALRHGAGAATEQRAPAKGRVGHALCSRAAPPGYCLPLRRSHGLWLACGLPVAWPARAAAGRAAGGRRGVAWALRGPFLSYPGRCVALAWPWPLPVVANDELPVRAAGWFRTPTTGKSWMMIGRRTRMPGADWLDPCAESLWGAAAPGGCLPSAPSATTALCTARMLTLTLALVFLSQWGGPLQTPALAGRACRRPGAPVQQRGDPGRHSAAAELGSQRAVLHRHVQPGRRDEPQAASGGTRTPRNFVGNRKNWSCSISSLNGVRCPTTTGHCRCLVQAGTKWMGVCVTGGAWLRRQTACVRAQPVPQQARGGPTHHQDVSFPWHSRPPHGRYCARQHRQPTAKRVCPQEHGLRRGHRGLCG